MWVRDARLVTIEAPMADRLRHILEELLPSRRRGVYICVTNAGKVQTTPNEPKGVEAADVNRNLAERIEV